MGKFKPNSYTLNAYAHKNQHIQQKKKQTMKFMAIYPISSKYENLHIQMHHSGHNLKTENCPLLYYFCILFVSTLNFDLQKCLQNVGTNKNLGTTKIPTK